MIHAAQKWARGKKNPHGYQPATLAVPDSSRNSPPPTSGSSASRSTPWSTDRTGGHSTSRARTVHNLASSSGIDAVPVVTCRPCVTRYSPAGRAGELNQPGGSCARWDHTPVAKHTENVTPRARPSHAAVRSSGGAGVRVARSTRTTARPRPRRP